MGVSSVGSLGLWGDLMSKRQDCLEAGAHAREAIEHFVIGEAYDAEA
jgi:hypothetical protein